MFDNYERKLHKCIAKFIKRANKDYPDWSESRDNGEWEIDLNEFDDMCDVIFDIIRPRPVMKLRSRCLMIFYLGLQGITNVAVL